MLARVGLVLQLEFVAKEFGDEHLFTYGVQSNHTLPLVRRKLSQYVIESMIDHLLVKNLIRKKIGLHFCHPAFGAS